MKSVIASAAFALTLSAAPAAFAANARMPYQNVDHSNDAGNGTGDNRVDDLNAAQLDQNYKGQYYTFVPGAAPPASATPSGTQMTDDTPAPAPKPVRRPMRSTRPHS